MRERWNWNHWTDIAQNKYQGKTPQVRDMKWGLKGNCLHAAVDIYVKYVSDHTQYIVYKIFHCCIHISKTNLNPY
jgi:hypothetical protein